jgi:hypothetical protein
MLCFQTWRQILSHKVLPALLKSGAGLLFFTCYSMVVICKKNILSALAFTDFIG